MTEICPESEIIYPEEIFNEFAGEDGNLSIQEFSVIHYLYCQECTETIQDLFEAYDIDHDYLLSLEEFK